MTFYKKRISPVYLLHANDQKIKNLVENDGLQNPSSLLFTFRLQFAVYARKKHGS